MQERAQVLLAPGVVDDHQDSPVAQRLAELGRRGVDGLQPRPLAGQSLDEVGDERQQIVGLLAKLDPEDAVEIGVLDVGVMGERLGERRLAVAARAPQRGRDGDRVALGVEELLLSARRTRRAAERNRPAAPAPSWARASAGSACRTRIRVVHARRSRS